MNEVTDTWSVTYMGCHITGIKSDTIRLPLPGDLNEILALTELGYSVWVSEIGSEVCIRRPQRP